MTDVQQIAEQVSLVRKYLRILEQYKTVTAEQLHTDDTLRGAVERYLYLVTTATIDLAEAIISLRGFRMPTEYRESFDILAEQKLIERTLAEKLAKMVGFRNALAHDYADLQMDTMLHVLTHDRTDIEEFLQIINASF